jgi:hypothetical protein
MYSRDTRVDIILRGARVKEVIHHPSTHHTSAATSLLPTANTSLPRMPRMINAISQATCWLVPMRDLYFGHNHTVTTRTSWYADSKTRFVGLLFSS